MSQDQPIKLHIDIEADGRVSLDLTVNHMDELRQATVIIDEVFSKAAWLPKKGGG